MRPRREMGENMSDIAANYGMDMPMPRPYPLPLPPAPRFFVGREPDLDYLDVELTGEGVLTAVVSGPHGSGKTALVTHWADTRGSSRYPDGQMYVRMSGIITVQGALERLCHSMAGVPPRLSGLEPLHRRYCELIETREVLVFLDDVNDTGEARRWLVPPRGNCAVVMVTAAPGERPYSGLRIPRASQACPRT